MSPIEELRHEHAAIKVMLDILERMVIGVEIHRELNTEHLGQLLDFIRGYADECHHIKEEDIFFPILRQAVSPLEDISGGIFREHQEGREYVIKMSEAFRAYTMGDKTVLADFNEVAKTYIRLLRSHIFHEDTQIFPFAENRLLPEQNEEMEEAFAQLERKETQHSQHVALRESLHQLEGLYLVEDL
jgi:hemerythrin-like domain-containing protein